MHLVWDTVLFLVFVKIWLYNCCPIHIPHRLLDVPFPLRKTSFNNQKWLFSNRCNPLRFVRRYHRRFQWRHSRGHAAYGESKTCFPEVPSFLEHKWSTGGLVNIARSSLWRLHPYVTLHTELFVSSDRGVSQKKELSPRSIDGSGSHVFHSLIQLIPDQSFLSYKVPNSEFLIQGISSCPRVFISHQSEKTNCGVQIRPLLWYIKKTKTLRTSSKLLILPDTPDSFS